jgi:hypothetical protein
MGSTFSKSRDIRVAFTLTRAAQVDSPRPMLWRFVIPLLLVVPSGLSASKILSISTNGTVTFEVNQISGYAFLQFTLDVEDPNSWVNASAPFGGFRVQDLTNTINLPANFASGERLFFRIFYSFFNIGPNPPAGSYEVYGGAGFSTTDSQWWNKGYDPMNFGYSYLGAATNTHTFLGAYGVYIIRTQPRMVFNLDAVSGSTGTFYTTSITGNTTDWGRIKGPPDGQTARVGVENAVPGGFIVIRPSTPISWIRVYTVP